MTNTFEIISSYSRKDALEDGTLVDVSKLAKEVGFKFPVAFTSNLMGIVEDIPAKFNYQSVEGRIRDILFIASIAAKTANGEQINFKVTVPHYRNNVLINTILLKGICSPGDNLEPVITIMLKDED